MIMPHKIWKINVMLQNSRNIFEDKKLAGINPLQPPGVIPASLLFNRMDLLFCNISFLFRIRPHSLTAGVVALVLILGFDFPGDRIECLLGFFLVGFVTFVHVITSGIVWTERLEIIHW